MSFSKKVGVGGIPNSVSFDIHVPSGMKEVIEFFNSPGVPVTLSVTPGLVAMKACDAGWPAACFRIPNVCRMSADNYIFPCNDLLIYKSIRSGSIASERSFLQHRYQSVIWKISVLWVSANKG